MQQIFPTQRQPSDEELLAAYEYPADIRWVRANMVTSLDGAAQGWNGRSGTLSSPADKHVFAMLRALADVIVVGAGDRTERAVRPGRAQTGILSAPKRPRATSHSPNRRCQWPT